MRRFAFILVALAAIAAPPSGAAVLARVDEVLGNAFPGHSAASKHSLILDEERRRAVEEEAGSEFPSGIVPFYAVYDGTGEARRLVGLAVLDTHVVRTLPATVLIAFDPSGRVLHVEVLAFKEPPEYLPSERWFAQFDGESLGPALRDGGRIRTLAGATLSSRSITLAVRRALAARSELLAKIGEAAP